MQDFFNFKAKYTLFFIFILAFILRFLYFPENIYFGYDQARDAYAAMDIINRDLKIVGPPTSVEGLYHGVLYYYILAPLYFIGDKSPEFVAAAIRILNSLGVFLIFLVAGIIFNKKTAIVSAFLFAFSFEQTQFSIYMGNPSLAVLSILCMYTGLSMVIFKNKKFGLPIAFLGLGFSIQFQFALLYLIFPFAFILIYFREKFLKLTIKTWLISIAALILSLSTFILAEFKYNFKTIHALTSLGGSEKHLTNILNTYTFILSRINMFNITGELIPASIILPGLLLAFLFISKKREYRSQLIFLGIWFFSIFVTIIINGGVSNVKENIPLYYPNVGVSLALLVFVAFLISKLFNLNKVLGVVALVLILITNIKQIQFFNPKGTISEINVQQGMLLSDEKKVLDYMYNESSGHEFSVKGVTMPFYINTTWSYLFEWYGQKKYGYIPVWNGKNAEGFPGNLKVQEKQEGLPVNRFLIIEPTRGVPPHLIDGYLKEEGYFTKVIEEKHIGQFTLQKREKF